MFEDRPDVKPCCKIDDNLLPEVSGRDDLTLVRCKVCKCRHFSLAVDTGKFLSKSVPLNEDISRWY